MSLLSGLQNRSPKAHDKSGAPMSGSVNSEPVRSAPAKTPKTLGPRCA